MDQHQQPYGQPPYAPQPQPPASKHKGRGRAVYLAAALMLAAAFVLIGIALPPDHSTTPATRITQSPNPRAQTAPAAQLDAPATTGVSPLQKALRQYRPLFVLEGWDRQPATPGGFGLPKTPPKTLTTYDITTPTLATDYVSRTIAQLPPVQLEAGRPVNLYGLFAATSDYGSLMETRVNCYGPDGTRYIGNSSSRNHEGTENGLEPGTVRTVATHWLYTPELTGQHTCLLQAMAGRMYHPEWQLNVVDGTVLTMNTMDRIGGQGWGQPADEHLRIDNPKRWVLVDRWTAPAGVSSVRVHSGPEISVESTGGNRPFVGDVTLYVTQLNADGTKCVRYTKTQRVEVSGLLHHYKVNHTLIVPVSKSCSSRRFAIQTLVTYVPSTVRGETRHGAVVHWWRYSSAYAAPESW